MPWINKLARLTIIFLVVFMGMLSISNCGKTADQKAYEEILATMSMENAKRFFENYPESRYRDKLIDQITIWCQQENTEECYKMAVNTLPKDHPQYKKIVTHYEKHFGGNK